MQALDGEGPGGDFAAPRAVLIAVVTALAAVIVTQSQVPCPSSGVGQGPERGLTMLSYAACASSVRTGTTVPSA